VQQPKERQIVFYKRFSSRLFKRDAEEAHDKVARGLHVLGDIPLLPALMRRFCTVRSEWLTQKLFGMTFDNPVGLAAGMDKTGEALLGWQCIGFGFLEVGGFTRFSQSGNDKPRLFRLLRDLSIINRMGFNNPGAVTAKDTLAKISAKIRVPLFINIGKSKDVPLAQAPEDYAQTFDILYPWGDAFVVNVSSPNTLNVRKLQGKAFLKDILRAVREKSVRHPRARGEDLNRTYASPQAPVFEP
jgi:dihydroorotate dehydrogenase